MSIDSAVTHVVAALAMVIAASSALGAAARKLRQPPVIGQLVAGIALGPSLLGMAPGGVYETLFPDQIKPILTSVAQVALVLFLFAVGYELDLGQLRNRGAVTVISLSGFVIPMLIGAGIVLLYPGGFRSANGGHPVDATFILYMAVALSITAVPVLASIIRDQGLAGTGPATIAMAAAGVIDALSWPVLAIALIGGENGSVGAWAEKVALLAAYVLAMFLVVRPALKWWMHRPRALMTNHVPVAAALALASSWATSALGLHVIFGALLAGIIMPRQSDGAPDSQVVRPLQETGGLLLPVFFTISGMSVRLGGLHGSDLLLLLVICAAAVVGKVAAGSLSARGAARMPWRDSLLIGVLLNTRGLTELIVLNVGLQAGVIGPRLYALLVVMALLTTAAAGPLIGPLHRPAGAAPAERAGTGTATGDGQTPDTGQAPAVDAEPTPQS
ncbi:cation:proton antiporter [Streptomyces sp. NBC_00631]|uniref:cation:proton antiporter domain-containing protein n=1 Tax=Streptomyces sp. NBC_00631 TaxID=2975793 RepID=UPI0030E2D5CC